MKESSIQKLVRLKLSDLGAKMFRINVGTAWTGEKIIKIRRRAMVACDQGDILIKKPRPFRSGVPKGYPDLSGWKPTIVTQEMVGETLARFVAVEVKSEKGRASQDQSNFLEGVLADGGVAIVARSESDIKF